MNTSVLRTLSLLALASCALSARAALTVYTDRAAFLAAAGGGLSTVGFEGLANRDYQTLSHANEASVAPGIAFGSSQGYGDDLSVFGPGFGNQAAISSDALFAHFYGTPLNVALSPSVDAFGTDVLAYPGSSPIAIRVTEAGGTFSTYSVTPTSSASSFFGVIGVGGATIDAVSFVPAANHVPGLDNVAFGKVASVPGPLAALPFALMALRRRRRA